MIYDYFEQIARRLGSYPWYEVALEIVLIWAFVYLALRFLRGTRGAGVIKGFAFLLIGMTLMIRMLGGWADGFTRLNFIYDKFLGLVAILLVVVFQPELRRAMVRLGETRLFRPSRRAVMPVVEAVSESVLFLSKSQFGALIAIERHVSLTALASSGVMLDAKVNSRLLQSIFWPNNPLHDLGVVISGDKIVAASVQFPLIEEGSAAPDLGSRHRAGLGLSAETDSLVIIVSEETGKISIAEKGVLERDIQRKQVQEVLIKRLRAPVITDDDEDAIIEETSMSDEPIAPAADTSALEETTILDAETKPESTAPKLSSSDSSESSEAA